MASFFSGHQEFAISEKRGASGCAPVDPELVASIRKCGLLRQAPLNLNFAESMLAKLGNCLEEFRKPVLSEDKKLMLKQDLTDALLEVIRMTPEDFEKELEQIPWERYEDAHALPIFVRNLISAQKLDVGPQWHKYARTLPAFLQNLIGVPTKLAPLAEELAKRIATVAGGTGEPSSSISNVSNYIVPDGQRYDPKTICYIKEARIYTGNGIGAEEYQAYAAFCKGHQDMESRIIPFFSKLAAAEDSRRRMTPCPPCLEQGLHPFALSILIRRPHTANMVGRLMRIAAAKQVWSPEKTESTLRILEHCMLRVIEAFREWITPARIPAELWPKVYPNFPNTTGAQTLLTRVLDALLLNQDPTNEEFKRNASTVRERCNDQQRERLDFLLAGVDAWRRVIHSSDKTTQLYKDCQFLLLLLRAVHLHRILKIGGFTGTAKKAMKEKLETVTWQILQAIDPSLPSKEKITIKIDGAWRDCTQYVRSSCHPAGDAILMAANGKDVTTHFNAYHAQRTKDSMIKHCPEVRFNA
ncbi:unnamed protein product [Symbiodinium sp. CCMP2456]|nr:unnamed protein product [Symbiodinium sp. CCMP2456]